MIRKKNTEEVAALVEGGSILASLLDELVEKTVVGVTGEDLDAIARKRITESGALPVFLGYGEPPFPAVICVSVNDEVVHGIPGKKPFAEGDIVSIDAGLSYKGMIVDSARTVAVGRISKENRALLRVTKKSLEKGIAQARPGNTTGDIGNAVQLYVENNGFEVVRRLVGHGVGHELHEEPSVPNFGKPGSGTVLEEGMVIAIEPMVTQESPDVETAEDGWGIVAVSGKPAAHEEHTVIITTKGPRVVTKGTY